MTTDNDLLAKLHDFFKSHLGEALIYVFITTGGSLMPVWGGLLLYELLSINNEFWVFVDAGQFYIYSAALFTPSCYFLYRTKDPRNVIHSFIFLLSIFLLIASAILFAGISIFDVSKGSVANTSGIGLNLYFLRLSSIIIFIFSLLTAFFSQAVELKVRSGGPGASQVNESRTDDFNELSKDFDKLGVGDE
ncbi:MAG: hypothetical protein ABJG78_04155 [Cyclobacteriaceae bacterium]